MSQCKTYRILAIQLFFSCKKNFQVMKSFNSLPNVKFLDKIKFRAIADYNSNVAKIVISGFDRVENNLGYHRFPLFP